MSPREGTSDSFLKKIGIAARLFGKELQRNQLKWFDLRRADYRLGKKVVAAGVSFERSQFARRLEEVDHRLTSLRQHEQKSSNTFGEKVKTWLNGMVRVVWITALERKRSSTLKQLGAAVRKSPRTEISIAAEVQSANKIADRIGTMETVIYELRARTYVWARRPLLASSLLFLLMMIGVVFFKAGGQQSPFVRQENGPSSLSEDQFKKLEAQTAAFREQLRRQQAEMSHQEAESTKARIAAAERAYQEKADHERAAKEKLLAERAAADRAREAEEAARRKADAEKQKEEARIAAAKAQQEKIEQEKRERESAQAALAEQARLERVRVEQIAQEKKEREEAERRVEQELQAEASKPRTETSLAIERYLRSRYLGGGTDAQIIVASNAMAVKFDKAEFYQDERRYCFNREGVLELWRLHQAYYASRPWRRGDVEKIADEMLDCIPPRLLFNWPLSEGILAHKPAKPLPIEKPTSVTVSYEPDMLASEYLEPFRNVIYHLANVSPEQKNTPLAYWKMVEKFDNVYVLACEYRGERPGNRSRPYYFWYQHVPEGMLETVKTLPGEHPVRQIGPALERAPATVNLAMQLNSGAGEAEGRWAEIEKERSAQPAGLPDIPGLDPKAKKIFEGIYKAAQEADAAQLANSKSVVAASGGKKMLCPKCGGYKFGMQQDHNPSLNPYAPGSYDHYQYDKKSLGNCDECGGTGVVDAR